MTMEGGGEVGPRKVHDDDHFDGVEIPETAHLISRDSWFQAAFVLTTGVNSVFVLGYSGTIMVPLGWVPGVLGLIAAAAISLNANVLIAKLHEFGGKRHIRYRDLAGHIYGRKAYSLTWGLQYVNLFMINTGFIILAGEAFKAVYVLFREDHVMKLPYFIGITGFVCALFAIGIPYLSALRVWLGVSTVLSLIYIVIAFVLALRDGLNSPARDYSIPGDKTGKIFSTIGAAANLVFAYNTGMLPEIQVLFEVESLTFKERRQVYRTSMETIFAHWSVEEVLVPIELIILLGNDLYDSSDQSRRNTI